METILITGGSGMIGRALSALLVEEGYNVIWLSRERYVKAKIPRYRWDYRKGEIDAEAVSRADAIIHLSGSNVGEGAWTKQKKQKIIDSRVKTARLLFDTVESLEKRPRVFISASAVGYYGCKTCDEIFTESSPCDESDFLGQTACRWEAEARRFADELGIRSVVLRTGFVLSENSEGLKKMMFPIRFGLGAPLGKGSQYFSWVHILDLCRMYQKALEDTSVSGVYNAVGPEYITNAYFMKTLARVMKRPFLLPGVPAFFLRLLLGEAAGVVVEGSRVSPQKIMASGFEFEYPTVKKALGECVAAMREKSIKNSRR